MSGTVVSTRIAGLAFVVALATALAPSSRAQQPPAAGKTAEQANKNIQVFKDIPAEQLLPTMRFFTYALGVQCEFCHLDDRSKDDKPQKKTAREMILMVMAINKGNFNSRTEVTCYTCHRGSNDPVGVPPIVESTTIAMAGKTPAAGDAAAAAAPPTVPALPTADAILAKYVDALGGEQALRKVTGRVITGTVDTAQRNGQNLPPVRATFEMYERAPNMESMITHLPNGRTTATGFDGSTAWTQSANGVVTEASGTDLARVERAADFYEALDLKQEYTRMNVRDIEKVDDRDAYVVDAMPEGDSPERLFFDVQTGLLVRKTFRTQNAIGASPGQVDYQDYRNTAGIQYPHTIKITDLSFTPTYTILHLDKVDYNAPVDDGKLVKPASKPPARRP